MVSTLSLSSGPTRRTTRRPSCSHMTTEPSGAGALPLGPRKLAKPEAEVRSSVTWPSGVTARSLFCGPSTNQRRPWRHCGPSVKPKPVATSSGLAPGGMRASSAGSRRTMEGSGLGGDVWDVIGSEMAMAAAAARRRSGMRAMVRHVPFVRTCYARAVASTGYNLDELAADWRWFFDPADYTLLTTSPLGDLGLRDRSGAICILDFNFATIENATNEGVNRETLFPDAFDDRLASRYRDAG